jgi:zinc/manganese transport system substrate-binding protein
MSLKRAFATLAALTIALGPAAQAAEAKLKVVATLPDLAAVVREVGGPDVEVTALSYPSQDPHFVDARPSLVITMNKADLLVLAGLQLEIGWLPTLITDARNTRINPGTSGYFDVSTVVPLKQVPTGPIDRSMGDVHPGGNPHFMADVRNGARVAAAIATRLSQLDPAHNAGYRSRAKALVGKCQALAKEETARFAKIPAERRQVVTYHQSLIYLLDWLGLTLIQTLEPKPGIPPSPGHIASVLGLMKQRGVEAIIQEEYRPGNPARQMAERTGARVVVIPGGPKFEQGEDYLTFVREVADKVYAGLQK